MQYDQLLVIWEYPCTNIWQVSWLKDHHCGFAFPVYTHQ